MRFIVDADLPRQTAPLLCRYGHDAEDVRDIGMASAEDHVIAAHAKKLGACIVTGDFGFADLRNYPPDEYPGIGVIEVPRHSTAEQILLPIETFIREDGIIARLPGRLAIVEWGRIRLRPH